MPGSQSADLPAPLLDSIASSPLDPALSPYLEPHLELQFEPTTEPELPVSALIDSEVEAGRADALAGRDLEPHVESESEPTVGSELPAWGPLDAEAESDREDELAALETLPDELEQGSDVPLGEPLPEESNVTSWFDTQTPALATSGRGDAARVALGP